MPPVLGRDLRLADFPAVGVEVDGSPSAVRNGASPSPPLRSTPHRCGVLGPFTAGA